ncbi:18408_t:CDS:1, partial [Gigaspora rosea]
TQAAVLAHPGPDSGREIAYSHSIAHKGFHFDITLFPNETEYYLTFKVVGSSRPQQVRGPYDNSKDVCWSFHGSVATWDIDDDC